LVLVLVLIGSRTWRTSARQLNSPIFSVGGERFDLVPFE
jgi:hypothetical protein